MSELPAPIRDFLYGEILREQSPAFVLVDEEGRIAEWGGALDLYGIEGVRRGVPAAECAPFLEGLFPIVDRYDLPRVESAGGNAADVHAFRSHQGTWVVLRNATWTAQHERELQQSRNQLRLLEERSHREAEPGEGGRRTVPLDLLRAMDVAVLEHRDGDVFRVLGDSPPWLAQLWSQAEFSGEVRAQSESPFLANFLVEAQEAWAIASDRRSGPWTEVGAGGREWQLEATARVVGGRHLLTIEDVSGRYRERQGLLQQAREQTLDHQRLLKEIEKKDVLLHWIVHDLRTPLISAHAALQLLSTEDLPAEAQRTITVGRTELERQDLLIRSILDVFAADLDALDRLPTDAPPVDLLESVRRVVDGFAPAYALREVELVLDAVEQVEGGWMTVADPSRLARVIANLLDNALRHSTPTTRVRVTVSRDGDALRVGVEDQGPGVPAEFVPRLFDRFSKAGRLGKTGLGLHYCRITVESWGGRIGYAPLPDGGSQFWFSLPAARRPDTQRGSAGRRPV